MKRSTTPPAETSAGPGRRTFLGHAAVGGLAAAAALVPVVAADPAVAAPPPKPKPRAAGGGSTVVFNVQDYGAAGNGTHDDTAAIQSAITAAQAAGGGTVYLPSGTYKTTSTLLISGASMTVAGEGASSVIACAFAAGDIVRVARPPRSWPMGCSRTSPSSPRSRRPAARRSPWTVCRTCASATCTPSRGCTRPRTTCGTRSASTTSRSS
ncbi:MAG: twin-arginine translocation signal domain-containing protein [Actinobacteria bacterium]|nr:twin-arginine translocation signal domain-containing protein [Actinomycetota bacterium]